MSQSLRKDYIIWGGETCRNRLKLLDLKNYVYEKGVAFLGLFRRRSRLWKGVAFYFIASEKGVAFYFSRASSTTPIPQRSALATGQASATSNGASRALSADEIKRLYNLGR